MKIVIIGGGITGLAAAYRLLALLPDADITLVEADDRLGGKVRTERFDRFVVEAGPDSFLASKPRGIELCRELGIVDDLQAPRDDTRGTYVMRGGALFPMPEGLTGLVPSRLEPLLESELFSPAGKARLLEEPTIPPRPANGDETLAHFVERRFGREVYDRLIEPLMAGIYAGNGEALSLAATFPQLRQLELEHGSLIRGINARQPAAPNSRTGFATPQSGMAAIVEALVPRLHQIRLLTGTRVTSVQTAGGSFRTWTNGAESLSTDAVIVTVPAHAAATLLATVAPEAAKLLQVVSYVSTVTVTLGYKTETLSELPVGHGYVIPRLEGRRALACTWVSQKFANRNPDEYSLFRVFIGRAGDEDAAALSESEVRDIACEELESTLGITASPTFHRIFRWPAAMPQYTLGHLDRLARIDAEIASVPGLLLAGALRGVGIPDCIASGEAAAGATATYLKQKSGSL